ncbi:MAG: NADP-dependent malic enzyme [Firmicutes bacterium]|nr:NADP-dependent malic enzyme [Bacillota bacterium]
MRDVCIQYAPVVRGSRRRSRLAATREDVERASASEALESHRMCHGKIETMPKCFVRNLGDLALWYTPGVAEPCKAIQRQPDLVYELTNKWNTVAVVTDGSRVLGLGDIGPEAALPVMEGKAMLYKYLGGVDAVPVCLGTKDPDELISTVKWLGPSFGGINLEDIEQPKCFYVLDRLRSEMRIPVWHDDQQGTAAVTLAGLLSALRLVGKELLSAKIALIGAGAANMGTAGLLISAGVPPGNIVMCDSAGILHPGRDDLRLHHRKWEMCRKTNEKRITGNIDRAMRGADVVIALARSGPGVIRQEWVADMAKDPIVFACANPVPEIWPWEAKAAGAAVVATGRPDFPNQTNNSLGFPGIFRGALDVRARTITDEMCIAAARELAAYVEETGLDEERIIPSMEEWRVVPRQAVAVGLKAMEQGVAGLRLSREELSETATGMIERAREAMQLSLDAGIIPGPK